MSVTKEENGTWTAQFWCTDADGRKKHKKRRGFKTKREAREWERSMQGTIGPANMLLKDFVNVYYEDKKNELKDRTLYIKKLMVVLISFLYSARKGCRRSHLRISLSGRTI